METYSVLVNGVLLSWHETWEAARHVAATYNRRMAREGKTLRAIIRASTLQREVNG